MKHIFIVNPAAGPASCREAVEKAIAGTDLQNYEIYETVAAKDATEYIRDLCRNNPNTEYRFYACGGDGTLNEVANGVAGFKHASMTVFPLGSGNDYVKYFGGAQRFLDLASLINGEEMLVDAMKIGDFISMNVINFGFDVVVLKNMMKVKRWPLLGGKNAYYAGVAAAFLSGTVNKGTVYADGEKLNDETFLLCTVANGTHVGGSFKCAPRSIVNDGLMEVCLLHTMSRLRMPLLIGKYQRGQHLEDPACKDVIEYRQAAKVTLEFPEETEISCDGELIKGKRFVIENVPEMIRFVVPKNTW